MLAERIARVSRMLHPSAWRFLALVATDPKLDRFFNVLKTEHLPDLLEKPYPRYSLGAVEFIESCIRGGERVLEWGSGSSTLWFAARGCEVVSVEHDPEWFAMVSKRLRGPSRILHRGLGGGYERPLDTVTGIDLVAIDGRHRCECASFFLEQVEAGLHKPGVVVVFDDSQRPRYRSCLAKLSQKASWYWTFGGASGVVLDKTTSVFRY